MPGNQVVVFRPKPRALLLPAVLAGTVTTAGLVRALLHDWPAGTPLPWLRLTVVAISALVAFSGLFWGFRWLIERRHTVSVMPRGLQAPNAAGHQAFCGWDTITDAHVVQEAGDSYIRVTGRYLPQPLHIPLGLLDDPRLAVLIDQHAGEGSPLTEALRSAGA